MKHRPLLPFYCPPLAAGLPVLFVDLDLSDDIFRQPACPFCLVTNSYSTSAGRLVPKLTSDLCIFPSVLCITGALLNFPIYTALCASVQICSSIRHAACVLCETFKGLPCMTLPLDFLFFLFLFL